MTTITVASIEVKPKRSIIVTSDGRRIGVWADKLALFNVGNTYDVELAEKEVNGVTLVNVSKAKQVTSSQQIHQSPAASPTSPQAAPFRTPEQMFVSDILTAYIAAGKIANPADLLARTQQIREVWHHTFGNGTFLASEAGKQKAA